MWIQSSILLCLMTQHYLPPARLVLHLVLIVLFSPGTWPCCRPAVAVKCPLERKREKRMHQSGFCATLIIIPGEFARRMKAQITMTKHCGTELDSELRQLGGNKEQRSQVKFTEAFCRKDVCYEATLAPSHSNFNCVYDDCYQRCV